MKPEMDPFDEAMRRKLKRATIPPPEGVFDEIVPEKKERRRFLYWLLPLLMIPTAVVIFDNQTYKISKTTTHNNQQSQFDRDTEIAREKNSQHTDHSKSTAHADPITTHSSNTAFDNNQTANAVVIPSSNYEKGSNTRHKNVGANSSQPKRNTNKNSNSSYSYSSSKQKEVGFLGAYGKLPSSSGYQQAYIYPVTSLSSDLPASRPQQILHKPLPGPPQVEKGHSNFSVEIAAAYLFPGLNYDVVSSDTMEIRMYDALQTGSYRSNGYSIGLSGNIRLGNRWSAGAGLAFVQQQESASFVFNESYYFNMIDSLQYYILYPFTPPVLVTDYDTILSTASELHQMKHDITFRSATISVYARYTIPLGRFTLEPEAGAGAAIFTSIKGTSNLNKEFGTKTDNDIFESNSEIHLNAAFGLAYSCSERLALFLRSGYTFGLTSFAGSNLAAVSGNQFSAGAGLRWNFFSNQATKSTSSGSDIVKQ
jgi:Outer membrane protein beta-barrel domain